MLKRIPYGELASDRPAALIRATGAWATADGFRPAKSFQAITSALAGILGGAAYVGSDGTAAFLAGNSTNLYRYSGGSGWSSVLGSLAATSWRFDQFDDLVIGVNGAGPVKFDLIGGTAAALGGSPPTSDLVATVRDQVFLAGDPSARNVLCISGYLDAEEWTAGTNQSLNVAFKNGGEIMGLAGGETGIILQKGAIRRAIYTGDITVWQFDEIAHNIGCMAKGSVASDGQLVFFLSEQGFKMTDRNAVYPIGDEKIDRWFFSRFSRSDLESISCAIDPRQTVVIWAMPGTPGLLLAYNWTRQKWATLEISTKLVFGGFTANTSLDALDAIYPSGLDSIPVSLDSPLFAGGNPLLLIADATGVVGALSGGNQAAEFVIAPMEIEPGRRVRLRAARPVSDAVNATVRVDARARAGDTEAVTTSGSVRDNGSVPLRANGRHIGVTHQIPAGEDWSYALAIDLEYEREGER